MDYRGGPNVTTRVFINGRGRQKRVRKGDVMIEAEIGVMHSHEPRNPGSFQKLEKERKFSSTASRRNAPLPTP